MASKTLIESHLYWQKYFHQKLLYFRNCIDFEADKEFDKSNIGKNN